VPSYNTQRIDYFSFPLGAEQGENPVPEAKIVLTTFGSLGDLHPYLALARGLQDRGHSVVLATLEVHRARVEEAGLLFHAIGPDLGESLNEPAVMAQIMDRKKGFEFLMREIVMPHLERAYQEISTVAADAQILITHPITYAAHLFAEKHSRNIRWVSVALAPCSLWSAYDPPVMPPAPWLAHLRPLGPRFFRPVMALLKKGVEPWVKPWHELRLELQLPETARNPIFEGQFSPSLTLCMFSPRFGSPQPDWPPNAQTTGFAFYRGTHASELTSDLAAFLAEGEPPLVFTLGSSAVMDAGDFYTESTKAARLLGKRALLLVGRDPRNRPKDGLPSGVMACEYAPYASIFPQASVIVHQGGVGTTAEAMRAGKPMLVMPYGFDQFDNAARVSALGIGRTIERRAYRAETAARALEFLLHQPSPRVLATQVGVAISSEDGVGNACRAVESQLQ
jgi:rhamnosyltransferase subunit B